MRTCRNCHTYGTERTPDQTKRHETTCVSEWKFKWQNNNKYWRKDYYLRNQFGISMDDYNSFFAEQKGLCGICGVHQNKLKQALGVDHCHTTGNVRGLLCKRCNLMLGEAKDDQSILQRGILYLKQADLKKKG